jgi:hypothetical protein
MHHGLGERHFLNYLLGTSSECVYAHILEHLGHDFKVSLLLHIQMCHGGFGHVMGTYV